ncbi:hypothetical protein [Oceanobacillus timonensis]|uniref:hypothetical protein n=1 Tax=Oceanobacillus timonensis TaxID=1926285 RepID=UPI0009B9A49A|nr:hypothetical protein [Oceanobacillus timonensis]
MNKHEIHETIKNYRWMMKLLINKRLENVEQTNTLVSKYGIEATMPKAQGSTSDPVYQEIIRMEKHERKTKKIRNKIILIQKHSAAVKNERDQLILDELLDGKPLREIAIEMDMSLSAVNRRKINIVNQIYSSIQAEQMAQTEQKERICN